MLPERIKKLRKQSGLSQYSFARDLGVSQSLVAQWESGKREPGVNSLVKIADYFHVTLDYLFGRTDRPDAYMIEKEKLPAELADSGVKSVVKLGSAALSEEEVEAIRRLLAERPDLR